MMEDSLPGHTLRMMSEGCLNSGITCVEFLILSDACIFSNHCFRDVMEKSFPEFYDYYLSVINDNSHQNGLNMMVSAENKCFHTSVVCL